MTGRSITPMAMIVVPLLVIGCGKAPEPAPSQGAVIRAQMEAATTAYAECVMAKMRSGDVGDMQPTRFVDTAFEDCRGERGALRDKVLAFRRIGHPSEMPSASEQITERSVVELEAQMREAALTAAVAAKYKPESK